MPANQGVMSVDSPSKCCVTSTSVWWQNEVARGVLGELIISASSGRSDSHARPPRQHRPVSARIAERWQHYSPSDLRLRRPQIQSSCALEGGRHLSRTGFTHFDPLIASSGNASTAIEPVPRTHLCARI